VPILLGAWSAGLEVVSSPERAAVAFVGPAVTDVPDVYAIAPGSLSRSFAAAAPPGGAGDYVSAVRPQPDAWTAVHPPASPADPALDGVSRSDLVAKAQARAGELGLAPSPASSPPASGEYPTTGSTRCSCRWRWAARW